MALKLPDSAVPMGDFPVAKAVDIDFNDGENLQEKFDNGELGGAGGGASSEKQIKDWVSGETYEIGDYVYYDGKLYRCTTENSDIDFDGINWEQLTYDIDELSKEDVEGLLGLTKEEIEAMTDLILDTEVRIDKTYSSSKIYQDMQQCLNDSKTYTLEELEKVKIDDTLTTTDKTITGAINEINGNLLDTVGFSADYKNIILNRKSGLNPYTIPIASIINNISLTELKDIDSTDIGNGKTLVYDSSTQKHKYVNTTGTDEFVKMDSTTDAKYLSNLIDKSTVVNDNGVLKVKKLDGQEVTITEINYLKGLTMNVMDLVSAFANGGVKVLNTPLNTASELDTMDRTSFIEGISYIVYVLADETHAGAKTTYLVDKTNATFFGNADNQRNFTTNPIDLANEVTGKLGTSNIDVDSLWTLLTINDTYKTLTTNNEIFGTHGAKAMHDELLTEIGAKANDTDLTTHTNNTDIHITNAERTKLDKVDKKVDKTSITTTINSTSTDTQVPSAKAVFDSITDKKGECSTLRNANLDTMIKGGLYYVHSSCNNLPYDCTGGYLCVFYNNELPTTYLTQIMLNWNGKKMYIRTMNAGSWSNWHKVCTTSVEDVENKDVTSSFDTTVATVNSIVYTVKNGICYVRINNLKPLVSCSETVILPNESLPKPSTSLCYASINTWSEGNASTILLQSNTNGSLYLWCNTHSINRAHYGMFSYPVAE